MAESYTDRCIKEDKMVSIKLKKTIQSEQQLTGQQIDEIILDLQTRLTYWQKVKTELNKGTLEWEAL